MATRGHVSTARSKAPVPGALQDTPGGARRAAFASLLLSLVLGWANPVDAADVLPPRPQRFFNGYAGVVSPSTANSLNETLANFERATTSQLLVAIFPKLPPNAALEDFTFRTAQSWRVGQQKMNNGAVLFVFAQDRKLRIEVGYGLEGALPDALARRIIEDEITPRFRQNDYDGGLTAGVNAMMQAARGEYKGSGRTVAEKSGPARKNTRGLFWLLLLFVFAVISFLRRGGTSYHRTRQTYWGGGFWGSGFGGGGGQSGGGSSSSFSGGGGSFGGGGASGSW